MEGQTSGSNPTGSEQDLRERAIRQLKRKREFRDHLGWFIFINAVLWVIWALPPDSANTDDIWPAWVTGIWGVFLLSHAWRVYRGPEEGPSERQIEDEISRLRNR
ncbi:MAG TPA: 2TM domain-containing protein [Solirubrobacterales bacterium]|nr:2TM domain-containing protein [Solirubrobacterales bacterium]HEU4979643.1 2TM domain-containing protein [Solirubrobacterales bacterium]